MKTVLTTISLIISLGVNTFFAQEIYGLIDRDSSQTIFKTNLNCDTTNIYTQNKYSELNIQSIVQSGNLLIANTDRYIVVLDTINSSTKIIHDFGQNGAVMYPIIEANSNYIYGQVDKGGNNNKGYIFRYNITNDVVTILYHYESTLYNYFGLYGFKIFNNNLYTSELNLISQTYQNNAIRIDLSSLATYKVFLKNDSNLANQRWNTNELPMLFYGNICYGYNGKRVVENFTNTTIVNTFTCFDQNNIIYPQLQIGNCLQLNNTSFIQSYIYASSGSNSAIWYSKLLKFTVPNDFNSSSIEIYSINDNSELITSNNARIINNNLTFTKRYSNYYIDIKELNLNTLTLSIKGSSNYNYNTVMINNFINNGFLFTDGSKMDLFSSSCFKYRTINKGNSIFDFYPNNNELILSTQNGFVKKDLQLKKDVLLKSTTNNFRHKIFHTKNGGFVFSPLKNSNLNGYQLSSLGVISDGGFEIEQLNNIIDKYITEPTSNRIFTTFDYGLIEYNLLNNKSYVRVQGNYPGYIVQDFRDIKNGKLIYFTKKVESNTTNKPDFYVYTYDLSNNTSELIDSIMPNTAKSEAFKNAYFNYLGNNEISLTTNNGGTSGIGQVSIYNFITKTVTQLHSFSQNNQSIITPINHGKKLFGTVLKNSNQSDRLTNYNLDTTPIGINECFQSTSNSVLFSKLICINCTDDGSIAKIDEFEFLNQLNIYPNPTNGIFKISSHTESINSIVVFDNLGKIVYSNYEIQTEKEHSIDLINCADGMYTVKVTSNSKSNTSKIFLQK